MVTEATNEEKAINTLHEFLTAPTQPTSPAKAALVPETTHPHTNVAAPCTANLAPKEILNLCQPHVITQDNTELNETPP